MGTMRRVVLPGIRLILWAVIAVALCVIAFRETAPALEETGGPGIVASGADFTDPVVQVTTGTITNEVELTGSIDPVPATEVTAPTSGTAVYFAMASGNRVEDDDPLMTLRTTTEREPITETDADGTITTSPQSPLVVDTTVYANADGEITFEAELNEEIAQGDVVARVDPGENVVTATVPPESLYRLIDLPDTAEVTITNGPAPFACTGVELETTSGEEGSATELRCDVPEDVTVFPGLAVTIAVVTDRVEDAVVVPLTAVRGSYESGSVWVVDADGGEPVETPVGLGISDGEVVQVTDGLSEGAEILQFVPGTPATYPDDGMVDDGSGEQVDDTSGGDTDGGEG